MQELLLDLRTDVGLHPEGELKKWYLVASQALMSAPDVEQSGCVP